jgi:two-component system sensor histidine kinase CreC
MTEQVEFRYRESAEEMLVDSAQLVAALVAVETHDGLLSTENLHKAMAQLATRQFEARIFDTVKQDVNLRVYVTDRAGIVIYDSTGRFEGKDFSRRRDVKFTLAGHYGARTSRDVADDGASAVMYVAAPILWQGNIIGVVSVGKPTNSFMPFIVAAKENLVLGGIATGLGVIVLAIGVAIWLVRPFDLIGDYLQLIRRRDATNLPRLGRTAWGLLGAAFDEMRDALAGRHYVEEYVQALTHEIKSPLTTIRSAAELLESPMPSDQQQRFLSEIQASSWRIQDLVDRLLELAGLEKRRALQNLQRLDVAQLIQDAIDNQELEAITRLVKLESHVASGNTVVGDRFLLTRALINLIQNALSFSPRGGRVDITLVEDQHDFEILIRDQGPGIPDYALKRVFERFYSLPRPSSDQKSTGLGLSFVREISELHHGDIVLSNHPEGGAMARLRLPKASAHLYTVVDGVDFTRISRKIRMNFIRTACCLRTTLPSCSPSTHRRESLWIKMLCI